MLDHQVKTWLRRALCLVLLFAITGCQKADDNVSTTEETTTPAQKSSTEPIPVSDTTETTPFDQPEFPNQEDELAQIETEVLPDEATVDALWAEFLETLQPYETYIYATEFLDLDGNGVDELLVYESGMGICEVFTIEDGEVRSLYSGDMSPATAYVGEQKRLAPPAVHAVENCFWSFYGNKTNQDAFTESTQVNRKTGKKQYVQFTDFGDIIERNSNFYVFSMDTDGYLRVENPYSFHREAVRANPDQGWYCSGMASR